MSSCQKLARSNGNCLYHWHENKLITFENCLAVFDKIKCKLIFIWLNNSSPSYLHQRYKDIFPHRTCITIFIEALFVGEKVETSQILRDEWINISWNIHSMESYSAKNMHELKLYHAKLINPGTKYLLDKLIIWNSMMNKFNL